MSPNIPEQCAAGLACQPNGDGDTVTNSGPQAEKMASFLELPKVKNNAANPSLGDTRTRDDCSSKEGTIKPLTKEGMSHCTKEVE